MATFESKSCNCSATVTYGNSFWSLFFDEMPIFYSPTKLITHVHVYNERVVKCDFCDGTSQKAVLHEGDTFDLETGIGICLTKFLLEKYYNDISQKSGTSLYNQNITHALKTIEQDEAEAEREAVEAARRKHKIEQKIAKKERRRRREIEEFCQVLKETLEK